ncbi:hypothetical protein [Streptomyces sp. NPDC002403]
MKKKIGALASACAAGLAISTMAGAPAHAAGEVTLQNVNSGRCLVGSADRTVRMGPCDGNAKWREVQSGVSPMLVHVATGLCLDHSVDRPVGTPVYLSSCSGQDYGQLIGYASNGTYKSIRPVDSSATLVGWNSGAVSFDQGNNGNKGLWATI